MVRHLLIASGTLTDLGFRCEYIFYRGLYRTAYARVSRSTITDTELQIGQFQLPRYGHTVTDDAEESRYLRAWRHEMHDDHVCIGAYVSQCASDTHISGSLCNICPRTAVFAVTSIMSSTWYVPCTNSDPEEMSC